MADICGDNRFELLEKYAQRLIEATNIEETPYEMLELYSILVHFWQKGWLSELEKEN